MNYFKLVLFGFVFILFSCKVTKENTIKKTSSVKKNLLFIMVDDLRPELNSYGKNRIISPNIDALATTGISFNRAYCNVPVCGASRASLLTGIRPTSTRFLRYDASIKKEAPEVLNLVQHLKNEGYTTVSNNKITHLKKDIEDWDEEWYPFIKGWRNYVSEENIKLEEEGNHGFAYESPNVEDDAYNDGKTANKSIEDLKQLKAAGNPFFLAVGFVKPHLPFNAPKKYWDLYDPNNIELPENFKFPKDAPNTARHSWGELRYYKDIPKKGQVTDKIAKKLIHGYYASVSYVDAQIGRLLNELDTLNLRENTVIILVGDHGWSLMEHGLWVKHSNFEVALQVPLIVNAPGIQKNKRTNSIAELVDIYPSICDLINVPKPKHLEGESFVNALHNPSKIFKNTAFARYQKGETLIADNYFYTEWQRNNKTISKMLYDHNIDPNENRNLAIENRYKTIVDSLSHILNKKINP
ncbi:MAG: sulfatase [Polaribacter sp.]|nr:sulfatase [Polaribacter sp.]